MINIGHELFAKEEANSNEVSIEVMDFLDKSLDIFNHFVKVRELSNVDSSSRSGGFFNLLCINDEHESCH